MARVLSLFDDRVGVVSAALLVVAAVIARPLAQRWLRPPWHAFVGLATLVLIVAVTLVNRGVVVAPSVADGLTWWSRHWAAIGAQIRWQLGWWLNVALFVPAAFVWGVITRRPGRTWIALVVLSLVIETLHGTVLAGAGDPADLLANAVGAAVGAFVAVVWLQRVGHRAERPTVASNA